MQAKASRHQASDGLARGSLLQAGTQSPRAQGGQWEIPACGLNVLSAAERGQGLMGCWGPVYSQGLCFVFATGLFHNHLDFFFFCFFYF